MTPILSYCDGDETRLRRILKRMLPRKRVWQGYGYGAAATATLPPEARREDASSYSLPNDLATTFRVNVDAAKLYTALHALGTWTMQEARHRAEHLNHTQMSRASSNLSSVQRGQWQVICNDPTKRAAIIALLGDDIPSLKETR